MTTPRKRKSPDRKKKVQEPGVLTRIFQATGRVAARHPRLVFGVSGFAVVFGFVAANALWYQPYTHPAPFLATRDPDDPNGIAGFRPARPVPPQEMTTFRIAREDPAAATTSRSPEPVSPAATSAAPRELVAEVQRQLIRRGLYQGADDGLVGPQTTAAILFFEEAEGLPQTGQPTPELLAALGAPFGAPLGTSLNAAPASPSPSAPVATPVSAGSPSPNVVAVPAMRPREDVSPTIEDPVAAAIRAAEEGRSGARSAPARPSAAGELATAIPASGDLVIQIQRGLSNIAYTDIAVDGVAGSQTKAAIRRFEKHYRLPETGEPNELVLKKLRSIGAL